MRTVRVAAACVVTLLIFGTVAPATVAGEGDRHFRFGLVYSSPTDDYSTMGVMGTQTTELDGAVDPDFFESRDAALARIEAMRRAD